MSLSLSVNITNFSLDLDHIICSILNIVYAAVSWSYVAMEHTVEANHVENCHFPSLQQGAICITMCACSTWAISSLYVFSDKRGKLTPLNLLELEIVSLIDEAFAGVIFSGKEQRFSSILDVGVWYLTFSFSLAPFLERSLLLLIWSVLFPTIYFGIQKPLLKIRPSCGLFANKKVDIKNMPHKRRPFKALFHGHCVMCLANRETIDQFFFLFLA